MEMEEEEELLSPTHYLTDPHVDLQIQTVDLHQTNPSPHTSVSPLQTKPGLNQSVYISITAAPEKPGEGNIKTSSLQMVLPYSEPPSQEFLQKLPSFIHYPRLSIVDPSLLKPIDLSSSAPVTSLTINSDVAEKIREMNSSVVMSHFSEPSKTFAVVPFKSSRSRLRLARRDVLSKLGMSSWSEERKLLTAVKNADESTVADLLQDGVCPNAADSKGRTPLHVAASQGLGGIVSHLAAANADPNRQDILGNTPLHLAVCRGDSHTVNILLKHGASINQTDSVGRTPLCIVKSRLGTLRRDKSISTDKLISECLMIADILKVHCQMQPRAHVSTQIAPTVDTLCNLIKNISTREQADEMADAMIEKMSQLHLASPQVQEAHKKSLSFQCLKL